VGNLTSEDEIVWVKLSPAVEDIFTGGATCLTDDGSGMTSAVMFTSLLENEEAVANRSVLEFRTVEFGDEGSYVCTVQMMSSIRCYSEAALVTGN